MYLQHAHKRILIAKLIHYYPVSLNFALKKFFYL